MNNSSSGLYEISNQPAWQGKRSVTLVYCRAQIYYDYLSFCDLLLLSARIFMLVVVLMCHIGCRGDCANSAVCKADTNHVAVVKSLAGRPHVRVLGVGLLDS